MKTLKLLLCIFSICLLGANMQAQKMSFGPSTGMHFSALDNTDEQGQQYGLNWHGGIFASYPLSSRFNLNVELKLLTRKKLFSRTTTLPLDENELFNLLTGGGSLDTMGLDLSALLGPLNSDIITHTEGSVRMSYAELALPVDFKITRSLYMMAGPYFDLLASVREKKKTWQDIPLLDVFNQDSIPPEIKFFLNVFYPQYYQAETSESSSKSRFTSLDMGFLAGMGCMLPGNFLLEMRYTRGFFDYRSRIEDGEDGNLSTHQAIEFTLAYRISSSVFKTQAHDTPRFNGTGGE